MRGFPQRVLVGVLGTVLLALFVPACPHPAPGPITPPDASDAARPKPVSCKTACDHAEKVCPGAGNPCLDACNRIGSADPSFAPCVMVAPSCAALTPCDPAATGKPGAPKPNGR